MHPNKSFKAFLVLDYTGKKVARNEWSNGLKEYHLIEPKRKKATQIFGKGNLVEVEVVINMNDLL